MKRILTLSLLSLLALVGCDNDPQPVLDATVVVDASDAAPVVDTVPAFDAINGDAGMDVTTDR